MQGEKIGKRWRSNEGHGDFKMDDLAGIRRTFGGLWRHLKCWRASGRIWRHGQCSLIKVEPVSNKMHACQKKHKFDCVILRVRSILTAYSYAIETVA